MCLCVHFWCGPSSVFHVSSVFYVHTSGLPWACACMLICTCTSHFIDIDVCVASINYRLAIDSEHERHSRLALTARCVCDCTCPNAFNSHLLFCVFCICVHLHTCVWPYICACLFADIDVRLCFHMCLYSSEYCANIYESLYTCSPLNLAVFRNETDWQTSDHKPQTTCASHFIDVSMLALLVLSSE